MAGATPFATWDVRLLILARATRGAVDGNHDLAGWAALKTSANWDECLEHAAISDIGMRRATNQDAYAVILAGDMEAWRQSGHLFVVADGMGAHAAGELASTMAVSGISHRYHKYHHLSPPEALQRSIQETNAEVHRRGQANLDFHNMGTTTSVLLLLPQGALVAHVGDSRVYRQRGQQLEQLTFDHSLVWEIRASRQFAGNEEFASSVPKNIITRSLGPNATIQTDFEGPFPVELGDTFLLCSDGLSGMVEDDEIGALLSCLPPQQAAQALIDLANLRGGHDNITVIVVRVTGEQMTTRAAGGEPLTIRGTKRPRRSRPAPWIAASVCFLAALALAVLDQRQGALAVLAVGLVAVLFGIIQRWILAPRRIPLGETRRFGKGPYVTVDCPVDSRMTDKLAALVEQLRSAIEGEEWAVDVSGFSARCDAALRAATRRDFSGALRHYVHAISYMMSELREQSRRHGNDRPPPQTFGN